MYLTFLKYVCIVVVIKDKQATLSATTKTFGFDKVFGPTSKQVDVHKAVVGPLIQQVLQVKNTSVLYSFKIL